MNQNNFESLGVAGKFLRALKDVGYTAPTPIQGQAIPHLLEGKDLLGVAQTGTGKTAAFALPLLQRLDDEQSPARPRQPRALILAPTRELALQINEELENYGRYAKLRHAVIFGGVGQNPQVKALARGLDVVVATPGRLLDLAAQGHCDLSTVSVLVLDEADRLLDMGFVRDVKRIVAQTPRTRQSLLFSATMPKEVAKLAREILIDPVRVDVSPKQVTVKEIEQRVVMVGNSDKRRTLERLLRDDEVSRAIVFTRTKHGANKVARQLVSAGIGAEAIHGNKSQNARQRALQNFKNGDAWVLVATDIAARGIDIDGVSHVINYELPHEPESYVHRIGRTGRAGAAGVAWSLVDPAERPRLKAVEKLIRFSPEQVVVKLPPRDETEPARQQSRQSGQSSGTGNSGGTQNDPERRRRPRRRRRQRAA
ncbi:MAG: DEAD/DEAH box helicase [Gammaproteobacteria bacterium]|nr:DEAD/DEAH box helicase [Gammaproteobacteria bacterium]